VLKKLNSWIFDEINYYWLTLKVPLVT
jgi:hypothetical protein